MLTHAGLGFTEAPTVTIVKPTAATATSSSFATTAATATTASFATTASYAANGGGGGGGVSYTSYVAKIIGNPSYEGPTPGNPVTASVLENTTGLTINWTQ